jgi:hypothetical protein
MRTLVADAGADFGARFGAGCGVGFWAVRRGIRTSGQYAGTTRA